MPFTRKIKIIYIECETIINEFKKTKRLKTAYVRYHIELRTCMPHTPLAIYKINSINIIIILYIIYFSALEYVSSSFPLHTMYNKNPHKKTKIFSSLWRIKL